MHNWFECKISYDKILENGMQNKVSESYLVDALSFTEAEARIIEEIKPYISGDFTIADIKRARLSEIFYNENGDRYFKAKIYFITLDEKSGTEKKTAVQMLAQASDIKEAMLIIEKGMEGTLADYSIASLTETLIMDIFPYAEKRPKDLFSGTQVTVEFPSAEDKDPLFDEAVNILKLNQTASTSLLQRNFSIGFNRATKLMLQLETAGVVGPMEGSNPRKILINQ